MYCIATTLLTRVLPLLPQLRLLNSTTVWTWERKHFADPTSHGEGHICCPNDWFPRPGSPTWTLFNKLINFVTLVFLDHLQQQSCRNPATAVLTQSHIPSVYCSHSPWARCDGCPGRLWTWISDTLAMSWWSGQWLHRWESQEERRKRTVRFKSLMVYISWFSFLTFLRDSSPGIRGEHERCILNLVWNFLIIIEWECATQAAWNGDIS